MSHATSDNKERVSVQATLCVVRGVQLFVAEAGEGFPLLCLHGFTGSWQTWWPLLQPLTHRCRLVMPDLLGHGQSDAPLDAARYAMEETVADLCVLMDRLGHPVFDCLGYSMGGRVALSLACLAPQRVRRLVLESASPGLSTEAERAERRAADAALADRIEREGVQAFVRRWEALPLFATQRRLPPDVQERQRAIRLSQRAEGLSGSLRGMGTGSQPSWWDRLGEVRARVLLVTGEEDKKYTAIAQRMKRLLPDAEHLPVTGAGHTVHLEQPARFVAGLQQFLTAP